MRSAPLRNIGWALLGGWAFAGAPVHASTAADRLTAPADEVFQWISRSADHQGRSFVILDKRQAHLWVFDGDRRLVAHTPVLLGSAQGDHSVPGIGDRPLSAIKDEERTTPAGRFALEGGRNAKGEDILWVDYDAAVSMHRVRSANAGEQRLQRLASPTPDDNRISYGCINVPADFYDRYLSARFRAGGGHAYVLPDRVALREAFPAMGAAPEGKRPSTR